MAIIEAKDNTHSIGSGTQQALEYAEILYIPFVFSSNGGRFLHDRTGLSPKRETELPLSGFPSPETLWERYCAPKNIENDKLPLVIQDYHTDISGKTPRYYQWIAINRTLEAIAGGRDRILLVWPHGEQAKPTRCSRLSGALPGGQRYRRVSQYL